MARNIKSKKLKFSYAVIGDGQTELFYLDHLKRLNNYGYSIRPRFFDKISIDDADRIIQELLDGGTNKVIYLTDYDTVVSGETKDRFNKLIKDYKNEERVMICETMPSIEFWFLLHYQYTTRPFRNSNEAENALKKYLPDYNKSKVYLENDKWFNELISENKQENAKENAIRLLSEKDANNKHFPFTKVHIAIEEFDKLKNKR